MSGMKEIRNSKRAVSTLVVVLVAAAVVAGGSVGAYYFLSDDGGGGDSPLNGVYKESTLRGTYGLNSEFTYDIVDNQGMPIDPNGDDIKAIISGESGSYYFIEIQEYDDPDDEWDMIGSVMVHKTSGEVRFATNIGNGSVEYEGTKNITMWSIGSLTETMEIWTGQDSVIYKMHFGSVEGITDLITGDNDSDDVFTAVLTGIAPTDPVDYVTPAAVGEMVRVSATATDDSTSKVVLSGTVDLVCIATIPTNDGYIPVYLVKAVMNGSYAGVAINLLITEYLMFDSQDDLIDVLDYSDDAGAPFENQNSIRLTDVFTLLNGYITGNSEFIKGEAVNVNGVMCDVYTDEGSDGNLKVYLGASDGIPYKVEGLYKNWTAGGTLSVVITLDGYVMNA